MPAGITQLEKTCVIGWINPRIGLVNIESLKYVFKISIKFPEELHMLRGPPSNKRVYKFRSNIRVTQIG